MEKQYKLQIKDYLISRVADEQGLSEAVVTQIIRWSYLKAREATKEACQVEIAGFGTFKLHTKSIDDRLKAREEMVERLQNNLQKDLHPAAKKKVEDALAYTQPYVEWLKGKKEKLYEQANRMA